MQWSRFVFKLAQSALLDRAYRYVYRSGRHRLHADVLAVFSAVGLPREADLQL